MKRKIIDISVDNLEGVSSSMKGLRTAPRTKKHYKGKVETILSWIKTKFADIELGPDEEPALPFPNEVVVVATLEAI